MRVHANKDYVIVSRQAREFNQMTRENSNFDYDYGLRICYWSTLLWIFTIVLFFSLILMADMTFTDARVYVYVPLWPMFALVGFIICVANAIFIYKSTENRPIQSVLVFVASITTLAIPLALTWFHAHA